MAFIRQVKADIVISWDPFAPEEEHPDHRAVAMATLEAASFSGLPLFYPEDGHPPHMVTEAYWFAKSPRNAELIIDISSVLDLKIAALLKHRCQMELTVDQLRMEAKALGVDIPMLSGDHAQDIEQVIAMGMRSFCAGTGAKAGLQYAEQFRYQKLGMLEQVLGTEFSKPDFA